MKHISLTTLILLIFAKVVLASDIEVNKKYSTLQNAVEKSRLNSQNIKKRPW